MNLELTKANAELQNISNQKSSLQKQVDDINKINEIKEREQQIKDNIIQKQKEIKDFFNDESKKIDE